MRVSPIVLTLLCPICVASPPPPPPGGGCNASTLEGMNIVGSSDIVHFPSESAAECAASCCTLQRQRYLAYTWTSWQPHTTPQCVQHTKCCWLKAEAGMTAPQHNCTSGRPGAWTSIYTLVAMFQNADELSTFARKMAICTALSRSVGVGIVLEVLLLCSHDTYDRPLTPTPDGSDSAGTSVDITVPREESKHFVSIPDPSNSMLAACMHACSELHVWHPTYRHACPIPNTAHVPPGGVGPSPSPPSPPPIPGLKTPRLKQMRIIALDPTGNLRDPSAVVQDPVTGKWHFWAVYMPGATQPGWQGFLHHYEVMITPVFTPMGAVTTHDLPTSHHHQHDHFEHCHTD